LLLVYFTGILRAVNLPKVIWPVVSLLIGVAPNLFGHGDVHLRIQAITQQIAQSQDARTNASLYFQRADLYRTDGDWTNALADLDRVAQLDSSLKRVDYLRGLVQFEANHLDAALASLNKYLASKPKDYEAFAARARVFVKLGSYRAAVEDYTTAIGLSAPSPDLFIERADACRALGKPEEGLRSLDEGIRKIGQPLVTLELPAVDLEISLKNYDAALARIDRVMARVQRKETWLARRAEILRQAGREDEAQKNYREALAAIEQLPAAHRSTRAMAELQARVQTALINIKK
jgi:tetratricopeptide (TPR) repeat protein